MWGVFVRFCVVFLCDVCHFFGLVWDACWVWGVITYERCL